jgi:hypothetical protein
MKPQYTLWKETQNDYSVVFKGTLEECLFELGKRCRESDNRLEFVLKYGGYLIYPEGVNPAEWAIDS